MKIASALSSSIQKLSHSNSKAKQTGRATVLAIDDNEDSLFLIQCALECAVPQCRLLMGRTGAEAVELANAYLPSLVLLDIRLPDFSGIEVLDLLRKSERSRRIPVVAVSASISLMDPLGIREAGFSDYLPKPYFVSDLENIISTYCS